MVKRVRIRVKGRVQGVGFRYFTMEKAMALEISGWVQNLSNGDVLAEGQGSEESINAWMNFLRNGPSMARVDELQTEWIDVMSLAGGFSIK